MADYSSHITIVNGYNSPTLNRISYKQVQGNWVTPPRSQINATESDTFVLGPGASGSEGEVTYRLPTGTQFKIYFWCGPVGNSCKATPAHLTSITYNASGTPLNAKVQMLEA